MTGHRPGLYWQLTWRYIGPAMMVVLLLASVYSMASKAPVYGAWNAELVSLSLFNVPEFFELILIYNNFTGNNS